MNDVDGTSKIVDLEQQVIGSMVENNGGMRLERHEVGGSWLVG